MDEVSRLRRYGLRSIRTVDRRPCLRTSRSEIGRDPDDRRDQRRREDQPHRAEQGAAADRHDQYRERVEAERGPHRKRLDELLEDPVGEQLEDDHPCRCVGAGAAERDQDRIYCGAPGTDVGCRRRRR